MKPIVFFFSFVPLALTNLIKKCVHMPIKFALLCWIVIYYLDIWNLLFCFFFDPLKKRR